MHIAQLVVNVFSRLSNDLFISFHSLNSGHFIFTSLLIISENTKTAGTPLLQKYSVATVKQPFLCNEGGGGAGGGSIFDHV